MKEALRGKGLRCQGMNHTAPRRIGDSVYLCRKLSDPFMIQYTEILSKSPVFHNTSPERIGEMLDRITWQVKRYAKGEMVALAGEECNYLYVVVEGSVKGEMTDASGRVIKIEDIKAPRPIAVSFIFGSNNHFPVNVTANEESALLLIPKPDLITLLQSDKQVLQNFLNAISSRGQFLSQKIRTLSMQSLRDKLSHMLLELAQKQGDEVVLPSSQTELADLFGVARPSLSRTLSEMVDEGIITVNRRNVVIHDRKRLLPRSLF